MSNESKSGMGGTFIGLAVLAVAIIIEGAVLNVLWDWFILQLGYDPISVAQAIGLVMIAKLVTSQTSRPQTKPFASLSPEEKTVAAKALMSYLFVRPVLVLFIGYVAHLHMS